MKRAVISSVVLLFLILSFTTTTSKRDERGGETRTYSEDDVDESLSHVIEKHDRGPRSKNNALDDSKSTWNYATTQSASWDSNSDSDDSNSVSGDSSHSASWASNSDSNSLSGDSSHSASGWDSHSQSMSISSDSSSKHKKNARESRNAVGKNTWPTPEPTDWPTPEPTQWPTVWKKKKKKKGKKWPTEKVTEWPTPEPTDWPTPEPTVWKKKKKKNKKWPTAKPTEWPTSEPWKKKKKKKKKKKWPTEKPTEWPTQKPTNWPTPEPTEWPTPEPTMWPTPEPTEWPTPEPTEWPTPEPTMWPTPEPTEWPTPEPTMWPTPEPTEWPTPEPTPSPIQDICPYEVRDGYEFDFVILIDNSCGLDQDDCDNLLEGVGEIISTVLDDTDATRVAVKEIISRGNAHSVVDFDDTELQEDPVAFVQYVRNNAECTDDGEGKTDTAKALSDAAKAFDLSDDRIDKIIVVSACKDTRMMKLCKRADKLDARGIDVYAVNLIDASDAVNAITHDVANTYLQCVTDDDADRVCAGECENGVSIEEFDDILQCLLPKICEPPTPSPTEWPTPEPTEWPTPEPTMWPTPEPTEWPTPEPTTWPTPEPTEWPTPEPTAWPTKEPTKKKKWKKKKKKKKKWPTAKPTQSPTEEPTPEPTSRPWKKKKKKKKKWPTEKPSKWPTPKPTGPPTAEPTKWPTPEPTMWPTPEPTGWPTPEPTDWPTAKPTHKPTNSPIRDSCEIRDGAQFDFIVLYDNTCGLAEDDCDSLLEGTGEIISRLLDYPSSRVQTMQIETENDPTLIVGFDEDLLQMKPLEYVLSVRQNGECKDGGEGKTNLIDAVKHAISEFDTDDDRIDKIVIVSACSEDGVCSASCDLPSELKAHGIDVYVVNLIKASKAKNVIKKEDAFEYLLCLADDDPNRVCVGDCSRGVNIQQFDWIIEECLLPHVCEIPTQSPTAWPTSEPTDWPTPEPTAWPTPEPTDWPTPEPTEWPTPEPTDWPTPEPTAWPTPEPTEWPTPEPTEWPTPEPTDWPTPEPTQWPTPEPTDHPTHKPTNSPIQDICPYEVRQGNAFDFVILIDNSCGLSHDDCDTYLEGVGEIISTVLDDTDATRVAVKEIIPRGNANRLVDFDDDELQDDPVQFVQYVRRKGDCTEGGEGKTDTSKALQDAIRAFDSEDDRIDKIIVVSACKDKRSMKYCKRAPLLEEKGIDVYAVNLIDASDAKNVITDDEADTYLECITDNNTDRICVGEDESGVSIQEFDDILQCLLPQICIPPTESPTAWPTPEPTMWPTPEPTEWPTPEPTQWPTPEPTEWPTPEPTTWPTPEPTEWPTPEPTTWPTPEPTEWPTPEPTTWPTPEPTQWPTPEPTKWPTPEPTAWPTPEPTEWPTPEPTPSPI
eukprot:402496_1